MGESNDNLAKEADGDAARFSFGELAMAIVDGFVKNIVVGVGVDDRGISCRSAECTDVLVARRWEEKESCGSGISL